VKITSIETLRVDRFPQQLWVQVHTDEGLTGLGETCIGPLTVEAHIHETIAPHLIGKDPRQIDKHSRTLYDLFVGYAGTGAETRGGSAINIALWDILGQSVGAPIYDLLGGASRDSIRIYNTCAGYEYGRGNKGALLATDRASAGDRGLPHGIASGPYEDLEAAINRPGELAQSLLDQGITGMKIWPFDEYARATGGQYITDADLRAGASKLGEIRNTVGSNIDIMLEMHAVWDLPMALRIARICEEFDPFWFEDPIKADNMKAARAFAGATRVPVAMGSTRTAPSWPGEHPSCGSRREWFIHTRSASFLGGLEVGRLSSTDSGPCVACSTTTITAAGSGVRIPIGRPTIANKRTVTHLFSSPHRARSRPGSLLTICSTRHST
jgi:galactonate dehydratase